MIKSRRLLNRLLFATLLVAVPGSQALAEFDASQKAEIGKLVREYLVTHPEVLEEAMQALEKKRAEERLASQKLTIKKQAKLLFSSKRQVVLGNPEGDVTLVEFFDYNCGYCRRALSDLQTLLKTDKNLKVVIKEWPVLGRNSVEAARVSIALAQVAPEKYFDFHQKLLSSEGGINGAKALMVASQIGVDMDKLQTAMKDREIIATIEEVHGIATGLGLTGTPSYVVGDQVIGGAVGIDNLKETVASYR